MTNIIFEKLITLINTDKRKTSAGWLSFNGPCCIHNGEARPDTRKRAGVRLGDNETVIYHCFNCKYKAIWTPGQNLNQRMKRLLLWFGVSELEIKELNFKIWLIKEKQSNKLYTPNIIKFDFVEKSLPKNAKPFSYWLTQDNIDPNFMKVAQYVYNRGKDILSEYEFYWTPDEYNKIDLSTRVIIPFYWKGKLVGWNARNTLQGKNRYYGNIPSNYLFNTEKIMDNRKYVIVVEGIFDAIAIEGVSILGSEISESQANWLNSLDKEIILLPDFDKQGGILSEHALKYNWYVSFPKWDSDIKDASDAANRYGKLYTIRSIIDNKTSNRLEINIKKKMLLDKR